jgi:hypothetical protein
MNKSQKEKPASGPVGNPSATGTRERNRERNMDEVAGYVPNKEELIQLVKFWHTNILQFDWRIFLGRPIYGLQRRRMLFACRRIDRLAEIIGQETVNQAIKAARDEFKAGRQDLWRVFERGTPEERTAVQNELVRLELEQSVMETPSAGLK